MKNQITFERLPNTYYPSYGFREKTPMYPMRMNFIFLNGGMGDYICWLRPIQWLAECATWIHGELIHPTYLNDLAAYFLKDVKHWAHKDYKGLPPQMQQADNTPYRGPVMLHTESLNATGAHLTTCGWAYFTNKDQPPEGNDSKGRPWSAYPHLEQEFLDTIEIPPETPAPGTYAVITTGVTTPSRTIKPEYWNMVIEYVHSLGLIPVFLGRSITETGNQRNIHTSFRREIRYDLGVDMLDKTSLIQAAAVMSKAALVVGHDNGLLHLAGCTDVPIVFGYNLASPLHRQPVRPSGRVYNVVLDDSELACNFCQSKNNFVIGYNFRMCMYNDLKCMDLLFADGAAKWKKQIDLALASKS